MRGCSQAAVDVNERGALESRSTVVDVQVERVSKVKRPYSWDA